MEDMRFTVWSRRQLGACAAGLVALGTGLGVGPGADAGKRKTKKRKKRCKGQRSKLVGRCVLRCPTGQPPGQTCGDDGAFCWTVLNEPELGFCGYADFDIDDPPHDVRCDTYGQERCLKNEICANGPGYKFCIRVK